MQSHHGDPQARHETETLVRRAPVVAAEAAVSQTARLTKQAARPLQLGRGPPPSQIADPRSDRVIERHLRSLASSSTKRPDGAMFVGSPNTVANKIVSVVRGLGLSRFDLKYSAGTLPHDTLMTAVELYGTRVIPLVREQLGQSRHVRTMPPRNSSRSTASCDDRGRAAGGHRCSQ